jgi:hypothetical protein
LLGGLLMRPALQVTQDEQIAVAVRQPLQLLGHHRCLLAPVGFRGGVGAGSLRRFKDVAARRSHTGQPLARLPRGPSGDTAGNAVEPAAERALMVEAGGLAGEDEEGGLEGVLGVLHVAKDAAAQAEHERSVSLDEGGEGGLLTAVDESLQQVRIGGVRPGQGGEPAAEAGEGPAEQSHGLPFVQVGLL